MKEAEMSGRHVIIEGFRDVRLKDIDIFFEQVKKEAQGCTVQFLDAEMVAGFDHLYFSVLNALEAYKKGTNISKNLAIEILLYASGQHQISRAIELLGIKPNSSQIALLIVADERSKAEKALTRISELLNGERCGQVIDLTDQKVETVKMAFEIDDLELDATLRESVREALTSLVVERVALLATQI